MSIIKYTLLNQNVQKISKMHSSITCFSAVAEANILHTLGGLLLLLTEPGSRLKAMIKIEERQKN